MKKHTNQTAKKRTKNIAIIVVALSVGLLLGGYLYTSSRAESPDVAQGKISKDEPKEGSSTTGSDSPGSTATPSMTPQSPTTPPVTQTNSLPTPVLAKSSGNNGSIPSGALVNFTCTSTPGYFCEVKLQKAGASTITLERKQLTGEMGQSFASWNWESISGTWSVAAALSDNNGQTKSSAAQNLEVR